MNEIDLKNNPIDQFEIWFNEAVKSKILEPNVMLLSTATIDCKPSGRTMLLKGFDERGFIFYANYYSRRGKELAQNCFASMTFYGFNFLNKLELKELFNQFQQLNVMIILKADQEAAKSVRGLQIKVTQLPTVKHWK